MADSTLELKWRFYEAGRVQPGAETGLAAADRRREPRPRHRQDFMGRQFHRHLRSEALDIFSATSRTAMCATSCRRTPTRTGLTSGGFRAALAYAVRDESALVGEVGVRTNEAQERPVPARPQWPVRHAGRDLFAHREDRPRRRLAQGPESRRDSTGDPRRGDVPLVAAMRRMVGELLIPLAHRLRGGAGARVRVPVPARVLSRDRGARSR